MKNSNESDYLLQEHSNNGKYNKKASNTWANYQTFELNQFRAQSQKQSESLSKESTERTSRDKTYIKYEYVDNKYTQPYPDQHLNDPETELMGNRFNKLCVELYNSKTTSELYLYLFLSNIVILIDTLFFDKSICLLLEAIVAVMFFMEVYANYILHGSKYCKSFEGLLDITMLSCCVIYITAGGYIRFLYGEYIRSKTAENFELLLVVARITVQLYRLVRYFLRHRKAKVDISHLASDYSIINAIETVWRIYCTPCGKYRVE